MKHTDKFRHHLRGLWCVYCGERSESKEHYPPRSYTVHGVILPACLECNSMSGTSFTSSFVDRCEYVRGKIRAKYRKALETPEWSAREISQMGRGMREQIKRWKQLRKLVEKRLQWDPQAYILCIDHGGVFGVADSRMEKIVRRQKFLSRMRNAA
jgi:hypothetical protein